jgi:hypothetical protein
MRRRIITLAQALYSGFGFLEYDGAANIIKGLEILPLTLVLMKLDMQEGAINGQKNRT